MRTMEQTDRLNRLMQTLTENMTIGPIHEPRVGQTGHCANHRVWTMDQSTMETAYLQAVQDDRERWTRRSIGTLWLVDVPDKRAIEHDYLGLTPDEVGIIRKADYSTLPNGFAGRWEWLHRQLSALHLIINGEDASLPEGTLSAIAWDMEALTGDIKTVGVSTTMLEPYRVNTLPDNEAGQPSEERTAVTA